MKKTKLTTEFQQLIEKANSIYLENFPATTCFERAVFFSWACQKEHCCKYCYMSTLPKEKRTNDRVRSFESILAETLICRELKWDYGFLSGGVGVYDDKRILDLLQKTTSVLNEKIWINIGDLTQAQLKLFKPYIKGVVGTVEILDPKLHKEICPSKPIASVERMFKEAKKLDIDCGMTLIVGLGETLDDFPLLEKFIKKHNIQKIHIYGLNPQKGTVFEKAPPPSKEYQAEWIARTRISFPNIDIQCGIWRDRTDYIELLLKAGANSVSKFPILKEFNSKYAKSIEKQAKLAGRIFLGSITKLPKVNWNKKIDELKFEAKLKEKIKQKLDIYLKQMKKHKN